MTIRTKLLVGAMVLAVVPVLLSSGITGWQAYRSAQQALVAQAGERLVSMREMKKSQVEGAFKNITDQMLSQTQSRMTIDAMVEFGRNYLEFEYVVTNSPEEQTKQRKAISRYYQQVFSDSYQQLNPGRDSLNVEKYVSNLDKDGVAAQYFYMVNTEFDLDNKEKFDKAQDGTGYTWFHGDFHPILRDYRHKFDVYDIYFVEPENGIVAYSVRKEIDYGTSLLSGSFRDSALADAFRQAMATDSHDKVIITDMSAHIPSLGQQSIFMAAPIFEGYQKVGVLVFQLSADKIGRMMTDGERWQEMGLSTTGENYIVGADSVMRSPSRFFLEQPESYLESVIDPALKQLAAAQGTTVGLQKISTEGVESALQGNSGFKTFAGYSGNQVMSAFTPLEVPGLDWVILSEIGLDDTLSATIGLRNDIVITAVTIVVVMLIIGAGLGGWFANNITRPIIKIVEAMDDIAEGEGDLTRRLDASGTDELSRLAGGFNQFISKIDSLVGDVALTTKNLVNEAHSLEDVTVRTTADVNAQRGETEELGNALDEVLGAVNAVTDSAAEAASAAREADVEAREGDEVVQKVVRSIGSLEHDIQSTATVIEQLNRESDAVGSVIDVISDIAEQTNLLALNAAIEAARAGEQGRGFAVVADEVRTLASRTQQSTEEIQQTISRIQQGTKSAVKVMATSQENAQEVVSQVHIAGERLSSITGAVARISDMNEQIAGAAAEQSAVMENVKENVNNINAVAERTETGAQQTSTSSEQVMKLADNLEHLVSQFKSGSSS
ncbi:MAG: methyl-accepting chemotaxis protein [Immundisolibacteraceae bacterium]|nr:methyl-accepting chemotaxis protein [Immundisolibacteraceae bacterium]